MRRKGVVGTRKGDICLLRRAVYTGAHEVCIYLQRSGRMAVANKEIPGVPMI